MENFQRVDLSGDLAQLKCLNCNAPLAFPEPILDPGKLSFGVAGEGVVFKPDKKKLIVGILHGGLKVGVVEQRYTCASCGSNYVGEKSVTALMAVSFLTRTGWSVLIGETI